MAATTMRPLPPITEPTAWLRDLGGQQVRRIRALGLLEDEGGPVILAPLVGSLTDPGTREDRTCDRCGTYVPPAQTYYPLLYAPVARVVLTGGLCAPHAAAEGVTA